MKEYSKICIFCKEPNDSTSIEHIVSESFGNKDYVMPLGSVCDVCNGRFSKFEQKALSNSIFVMERAISGQPSKKGKTAKGTIQGLGIEGSKKFEKQIINVDGLNNENVKDYDATTGKFKLRVEAFDKSEVATGKTLLKIGLEALYKSRNKIYKQYDFTELTDYLTSKTNKDWPFITSNVEIEKFISIPQYNDKFKLNKTKCKLRFCEVDKNTLLFKFKYGGVSMVINLLTRSIKWAQPYLENEEHVQIYPKQFEKRLDLSKKLELNGKH